MQAKFETKSNRVKGLAFHPTRPWILAGLHNGSIQLWDYEVKALIDKFEEHSGPVRSVDFHPVQPMFVSGSDDLSIKVWNYKQRRCMFTLTGHLDYLRTVHFHPGEQPWILSCSDDQTVRIWNWQSRSCIAVLSGHNHYVMSAMFHPREDLVVSASLDQTIRVWDISSLKKGQSGPRTIANEFIAEASRIQADLFGTTSDAMVKFILEGHERGVNWATFHPNGPYIASGSDDRTIKLWRYNEARAFETETYRGHNNNVSCVLFHPKYDVLISDSEDKTLKVWDLQKSTTLQSFRRENDRFWILAAHPKQQYIAAGHDSGLVIFKLAKERPAFTHCGSGDTKRVVYLAGQTVRIWDLQSGKDIPLLNVKRPSASPIPQQPTSISFSQVDQAVLLCYGGEGANYELYTAKGDGECKRGFAIAAQFVGRNRFAVLDKNGKLTIKDCANVETKRHTLPFAADRMFPTPIPGVVLLGTGEQVSLYNIQLKKVMCTATVTGVRNVVWEQPTQGKRGPRAALICGSSLTVVSESLRVITSTTESLRIKTAEFDENGVLLYNTTRHIKYIIPDNGETGIIRTIDVPIYITAVKGNRLYCIDRQFASRTVAVNPAEYIFKLALHQRHYGDVLKMIQSDVLVGSAIIAYLEKHGYPEAAMHFVRDPRIRFSLALECGNIDTALSAAQQLDDPDCWSRLGEAALQAGNIPVVELALQKRKDMARLSFLYLITGNRDKLSKMLKIATMREDMQARYHNALYLGDATERVRVLLANGLTRLAYDSALAHGLAEVCEAIANEHPEVLAEAEVDTADPLIAAEAAAPMLRSALLVPPRPVSLKSGNEAESWPLLRVARSWQDTLAASLARNEGSEGRIGITAEEDVDLGDEGAAWGDEEETAEEGTAEQSATNEQGVEDEENGAKEEEDDGEDGWGEDGDLGEELDEALKSLPAGSATQSVKGRLAPVSPGIPQFTRWSKSQFAADHFAAGLSESALRLLKEQVSLKNPMVLKDRAMDCFIGSRVWYPSPLPLAPRMGVVERAPGKPALPQEENPLPGLATSLKECYMLFTKGKFADAQTKFRDLFPRILLAHVADQQDTNELHALIGVCREYVLGLSLELERRELAAQKRDGARQTELAAYFTHCNLQGPHHLLTLRSAANCAFQHKELRTAHDLATRLLELNPKPDVAATAEKILRVSVDGADADALRYDPLNPFVLCSAEHVPIYQGSPSVRCGFCEAYYQPSHTGERCAVCEIGTVAGEATGLVCF